MADRPATCSRIALNFAPRTIAASASRGIVGQSGRRGRFKTGFSHTLVAAAILASRFAQAVSVSGDLTYTTDYIYRGFSESDGRSAAQLDVHAATDGGTFAGVFASSLGKMLGRGADAELEPYVGHRFVLSPSWSTTVTAVDYSYVGGNLPFSNDYQELSAALSYLDLVTISVAASPDAGRYYMFYRLGRYPAYDADFSAQLPLVGRLFLTAAAGYYSLTGPGGSGYFYGNAGLSFEYAAWRVDAGYYRTEERARYMFPYGRAGNRVAATLSWHF
jgi:uncharacterized protein (TIGR02001 family)